MSLIVQKFGGSSVADIGRIQNVARIVCNACQAGHRVVVVVSAMYGETDRLVQLAKSFPNATSREYDALLATGEQVTAALLSMALQGLQQPAKSFTGAQIGLLTTDDHKKARILDMDIHSIFKTLDEGIVPVVTGFQGVTAEGAITTLGRGGSDLTAVALAAALKADECEIYTDVDGVYTSDPKIVPDARKMQRISFDEMIELSSMGAKVLQQRCLEFAGKYEVPVRVLSSLKAGEGTLIDFQKNPPDQPMISGVAFDRNQSQITLQDIPERPGLASYILGPISHAQIEVDMILQNSASSHGRIDFSFTVPRDDFKLAYELMEQVQQELQAAKVLGRERVAKLSLVGVGMRSYASVASRMFSALGKEGIEVHSISTSEIKISAVIDEQFLDLGARTLHEAFMLDEPATV